jgi:glycosyltransferase involved in cell wall biosynthesis
MKILYIAGRWDPRDHNQASGTDFEICQALTREGAELEIIGPFLFPFSKIESYIREIYRRLFGKVLFKYPLSYFRKCARQINQVLERQDFDLIVSFYSAPLLFTKVNKPLLYICDSTAKWVQLNWKYRAWFTYQTMYFWESKVIQKASHIITFSESSAKVLREIYAVDPAILDVFPIPASLPIEIVPEEIVDDKGLMPLNLLLVGREFKRKGVDIAIDVINDLNARGIETYLRIIGLEGNDTERIRYLGLYNKTIPAELEEYMGHYQWANFLLHPARFEAAGIVPSEAAAFGVPTITNDAGGLTTTVKDGISGIVLPRTEKPADYVNKIRKIVEDPVLYSRLRRTSKERYDNELNWNVLGKKIYTIAENLVKIDS